MNNMNGNRVRKMIFAVTLAVALLAGGTTAQAEDRDDRFEFAFGVLYQLGADMEFDGGSSMSTNDDWGFSFLGGYNLNEGGFCRIPSAETRARISAASKGRKMSAEARAKISAALTGRVITWGSKISAARVGSRPNEAQAEALRRGREGRWVGDNRMRARTHNPNRKISLEDDTEIRRLRAEEGWTQQRLADKFGLSQPYVGKLLRSPVLVMEDCSTCGGDGRVPCPEVFREPGCGPGCYTCKGVGSVPCPEEAE